MEYIPIREKDGGPIINWLADKINYIGCWLVAKSSRYALMYTVDADKFIEDSEEE